MAGYFAGREHLKYEVRQAFSGASESFAKGLKEGFGAGAVSADLEDAQSENGDSGELELNPIAFGESLRGKLVAVSVESAVVGKVSVRDIMGDEQESTDEQLMITLRVRNTHDRKVVRFRDGNGFLRSQFTLKDDVENVIRSVSYGLGSEVIGALDGTEDILPSESATHVVVFQVPPPKTESLLLSIDLEVFDDEGEGVLEIPAGSISGFRGSR